jgi:hypothetical protein
LYFHDFRSDWKNNYLYKNALSDVSNSLVREPEERSLSLVGVQISRLRI